MENLKRRKPVVALLLSLITPGLGQMYNGQLRRGITLYLAGFLLATILSFTGMFFKFYGMILSLVIILGFLLFILLDVLFGAIKLKKIALTSYNKWYIYLVIFLISTFVIGPLLSGFIRSNIVRAYKIPSSGMEPTLLVGDYLIANVQYYKNEKPKRGDIIIFPHPKDASKDFIKRVIASEGEKLEIVHNKIYISDRLIEDPWGYHSDKTLLPKYSQLPERFGPVVVPEHSLFVLGDNRDNSQDSRFWGFVDVTTIKGKAMYIYWSKNKSRIGMNIR